MKLEPKSAEAVYNLGLVLKDLGQFDTALACFERTLSINPEHVDCHWDQALTFLTMGDLVRGFTEYEWRWRRADSPPRNFTQPLWDGAPLDGRTILLHQEQGFGDMIKFVRYAPMVKELGGIVLVECQPELARLFTGAPGVDRVVLKGAPLPPFDVYAPMLSLPRILGTTLDTIPAPCPYLARPERHNIFLPNMSLGDLKIGVSWAGKPTHRNDRNRSCPFSHFLELAGVPNTTMFSLQKGKPAAEIGQCACTALVTDLAPALQDFADTAAVISQLDLIITVDTAPAHLAGAMGREVWVLVPYVPDWRWLTRREDTPWYPTMRLFRQSRPGAWEELFDRVRKALEGRVRVKMAESSNT